MRYDEIIERLMETAGIEDEDSAERLALTVLEVLAERITRTERDNLAAQLPDGLKAPLEETRQDRRPFQLEEFYNRVRARADLGFPAAVSGSKAMVAVLQEAVTAGEIDDIRQELGSDFAELFEKE